MYKDKEKLEAWKKKNYEKSQIAYAALLLCYPFNLDDLPGETWKWILGYEGHYQISTYGRLKSFNRKIPCIVKPDLSPNGYLRVALWKNQKSKHYFVHVLVAKMFIPNPDDLKEVNHKFGNKFDNYVENLEWVTASENMKHAIKMGLRAPFKPHNIKLTEEQIRYIRENYIPGDKNSGVRALAKKFNVGKSTISNVINKRTYKNVK